MEGQKKGNDKEWNGGTADEQQVGGDHYSSLGEYQPWIVLEKWMSPVAFSGFLLGTVISYLGRFGRKGTSQDSLNDLKKARHVLDKLIETLEKLEKEDQ